MPLTINLAPYDRTFGQNGMWCTPNVGYTTGTVVAGGSTARWARFFPTRNMSIVKIGFVTTVAATNDDACDVALYNAAGTLLTSSGSTSGKMNATAGAQTVAITATALTAGTAYYAALCYGTVGGTAATLATFLPPASNANTALMFGSGLGAAETAVKNAAFPLATQFPTFTIASTTTVFALAVLES
jgi:hypothetical protein